MTDYVIAEINQASHQVETVHGPYDLAEATEVINDLRAETAQVGCRERYFVAELTPVEEAS